MHISARRSSSHRAMSYAARRIKILESGILDLSRDSLVDEAFSQRLGQFFPGLFQ